MAMQPYMPPQPPPQQAYACPPQGDPNLMHLLPAGALPPQQGGAGLPSAALAGMPGYEFQQQQQQAATAEGWELHQFHDVQQYAQPVPQQMQELYYVQEPPQYVQETQCSQAAELHGYSLQGGGSMETFFEAPREAYEQPSSPQGFGPFFGGTTRTTSDHSHEAGVSPKMKMLAAATCIAMLLVVGAMAVAVYFKA